MTTPGTITRVFSDYEPPVIVASRHEAGLSPLDRGFTLGDAIFETMRVCNGKPFRLGQHLSRMRNSAAHFGIQFPEEIQSQIRGVLEEGSASGLLLSDCALRVTLSRGVASLPGLTTQGVSRPTVAVLLIPLPESVSGTPKEVHAVIAESRRNEFSASAGHKTVAFADSVLELMRAKSKGADDCIFLDTSGHISEASASNVFLVDGSTLLTPARSCGALPGITRAIVLELARGMSLAVEERTVEMEELLLADEVFLTSAVRGVAGVGAVAGRQLKTGREGSITSRIQEAYRRTLVEESNAGHSRESGNLPGE